MNTPYIKQFNENGECINPLQKGFHVNKFPNREQRRRADKEADQKKMFKRNCRKVTNARKSGNRSQREKSLIQKFYKL